jgi:hypothetical protein
LQLTRKGRYIIVLCTERYYWPPRGVSHTTQVRRPPAHKLSLFRI